MFSGDNLITWNRNLSFLRDPYYQGLISSGQLDHVEQAIIWRTYILLYFAESCQDLVGDYMELGVYKGNNAARVAERVDFLRLNKKYWLYDLFSWKEGDEHTHLPAHDDQGLFGKVVNRFAENSSIIVIQGSVPNSFDDGFPEAIAFAHIDMNNHDPEAGALSAILPKLCPRGVVVFDDYGWWGYSRQKRVLDEIAKAHDQSILELPTGQGIMIKT